MRVMYVCISLKVSNIDELKNAFDLVNIFLNHSEFFNIQAEGEAYIRWRLNVRFCLRRALMWVAQQGNKMF